MTSKSRGGSGRPQLSDRAAAVAAAKIPADAERRLAIYAELLEKWQRMLNLVAASTLPYVWTRHFADSWQVLDAAPHARIWADLGSGGGFPGLVTAIRLADTPGARVHLIESDQRKCAFLRDVSRETGAAATVHCGRIEAILDNLSGPIYAISARALAPLPQLVAYARKPLQNGAIGVFSKGQDVAAELTDSSILGRFDVSQVPSQTSPAARLVIVRAKANVPEP